VEKGVRELRVDGRETAEIPDLRSGIHQVEVMMGKAGKGE
jgi:hypothetical protein